MRVAILNTNDFSGGAARAAYSLYNNLSKLGVDVKYFVQNQILIDKNIIKIKEDKSIVSTAYRKLIEKKIEFYRTPLSNTLFHIHYTNQEKFPLYLFQNFDIINLHWIAYFLSPENIYNLGKEKHLVWTLHDQAPLTGGCHYTGSCEGYKLDCQRCKQTIFPKPKRLPGLLFEEKINFLSHLPITFVVASRWMGECIKSSRLFSKHRIEYIPYSIDTTFTFKQKNKLKSKQNLGIPDKKITILFGADNGNEIRKGFSFLVEAIKLISKDTYVNKLTSDFQIQLVYLGKENNKISNIGIPCISIDRIDNDTMLCDFYNSGDLLVLPSIEDNLPLTMLESIASGTPVVAFNVGGMKDIIKSGINGELADEINSESLSKAILKLIYNFKNLNENKLSDSSSNFANKNFSNQVEASKYLELFQELNKSKTIKLNFEHKTIMKKIKFLFFLDYIKLVLKLSFLSLLFGLYKYFVPETLKNLYRKFRSSN